MMRDPELESYSRMVLKLRATEQENRQLRTQIVAIRREEQLRIARDLHDKVAGQAASLHYFIAAAANDSQDIAPAVALSRSVLEQLRNSVSDIRDEEASTFAAELDRLRLLYPQLRLGVEGELPTELDHSLITVLICCIQECMTNELKHSQGNELKLAFDSNEQSVSVVISSLVPLKSRLTEGNGLKGMRERIENEGGEMRVLAKPASEMQCFLSLPLSLAVN